MKDFMNRNEWRAKVLSHASLVGKLADAFVNRRSRQLKHPVHDFLFTYYTFSPQKLKQWVPRFNESLVFSEEDFLEAPWLKDKRFRIKDDSLHADLEAMGPHVKRLLSFVKQLCTNIVARPRHMGCYGLHEWAMVYKVLHADVRHQGYPLRLSLEEISDFIKTQTLSCTHYDAYRFFSPEATSRNTCKPTLDLRLQHEQGGCLHANMDLYKWGAELWPWIGSDFIAKAFLLAVELRELDMRASPYDLESEGYPPIYIETAAGRLQYQQEQHRFAMVASCLRQELLAFCNMLESAV